MKLHILLAAIVAGAALYGCSKTGTSTTANLAVSADSARAADSALAAKNQAAPAGGAAASEPVAQMSQEEKGERDLPPGKAPSRKSSSGKHKTAGSSSGGSNTGGSPPKPAEPTYATVPEGSVGAAALIGEISSETAKEGDEFTATLSDPIMVDGAVVIPAGAKVVGHVTAANSTGRGKTKASLAVAYDVIQLADGSRLDITAKPQTWQAAGNTKGDIIKTGAGALIGGIIGGASGNTKRGVLIGGAAGAGLAVASRGEPVILKAGSKLNVTLAESVKVPLK